MLRPMEFQPQSLVAQLLYPLKQAIGMDGVINLGPLRHCLKKGSHFWYLSYTKDSLLRHSWGGASVRPLQASQGRSTLYTRTPPTVVRHLPTTIKQPCVCLHIRIQAASLQPPPSTSIPTTTTTYLRTSCVSQASTTTSSTPTNNHETAVPQTRDLNHRQ
jgi:hypothetical protein